MFAGERGIDFLHSNRLHVRYTPGTRKRRASQLLFIQGAGLAGAVGLEPTPSSLTVRCPTNWTTPQPCSDCKREWNFFSHAFLNGLDFAVKQKRRRAERRKKDSPPL